MTDRQIITKKILHKWLKKASRIVVLGIGTKMRRDDYVGIALVKGMRQRVPDHVMLIESEITPESYIQDITEFNPTHILLIDAGLLGLDPGEAVFFQSTESLGSLSSGYSTHALPLAIFCKYLEKSLGVRTGMIIIQPERTDFGESLSSKVKKRTKELRNDLLEVLSKI